MKNNLIGALIIAVSLPLDIISKNYIVDNFGYGDRVDYLGGFLRITLVYNEGGVFGILQGYKNLFLVMSIIVLILMLGYYFYEKNKGMMFTAAMSLIVSGALGNIIDRLIPGRPGVVDFVYMGFDSFRWPAFNVADSVIVAGAILLIIVVYREDKKHKKALEKSE